MKISLVIPVFNEEKRIADLIKSLLSQSEKADEIIIVNNNSTDKTVEIVKRFPVRIVNEPKQGISHARNKGFDEAQYEIIARTDADTILPANWIAKIKNNFLHHKVEGVSGPFYYAEAPSKNTFYSWLYLKIVGALVGAPILFGPNMAITKSIWEKVRKDVCMDDKRVHEDIDISIHIARKGGKIFIDKSLVVPTSARRLYKAPWSFFIEYLIRLLRMTLDHRLLHKY
ncbi:hypothetical protein A3A93_06525 [Candidatus Roizmanbacteria bacterium RIFCSPLOWO2_01_FULL_38_12]|uniref:Glycosyltransferase 2-like domain-containing protein n=1 Tax=Candidatus Roizmanbacteria bacterium RIFCSPLOWO2_01_FULL_38_12 TaxID=1802061 RepID=A0A1F7ISD1_9BACT|nr:MAG: hypothetical protein A3A93_06525 [Candidatus Roizmanbacteria bacterium RIFCSPLOWO2_01_FULL_38_12]